MKPLFKKLGLAVLITMAAVFVFLQLTGPRGIQAALEKRQRITEMQRDNAELSREVEQRKERIRRLEQDREEQELEVRRRLKLQKKDSFDFYLPPSETEPASPVEGQKPPPEE